MIGQEPDEEEEERNHRILDRKGHLSWEVHCASQRHFWDGERPGDPGPWEGVLEACQEGVGG